MASKHARYLTFGLAAAIAISNAVYLVYLRDHPMVRSWSGANAVLLGLFMLAWSAWVLRRQSRSAGVAIGAIGVLNLGVGALFFL